jgi:hypothetical protein
MESNTREIMRTIILIVSTIVNIVVIFALPVLAETISVGPESRKDFMTIPTAPAALENTRVLTVGPDEQYATIQEAVNDASQGSTILVYPGIYNEEVVIDKNNLQILAQGEYVNVQPTEFDPDDKRTGFSVIADHVTIRGFNIGFGGGCFPAIGFRGSHNTFANNYMFLARSCPGVNAVNGRALVRGNDYNVIEGNTIDHADLGIAIGISPQSNGGFLHKGNIIRNNIIRGIVQTPIAIENGDGFLVSGNRIEGGAGFCIDVGTLGGKQPSQGHHTIVGNYMEGCSIYGIWLYANAGDVMTDNRISDNRIVGCPGGGKCIALTAYLLATVANNVVSSNSITPAMSMPPNGGDGIVLEVVERGGTVNDNLIRSNRVSFGSNGIVVTNGADRNRLSKNDVRNSLGAGISVSGNNNLIVDNVSKNNNLANSGLWDLVDFGQDNKWINNTYGTSNF